jgi:hypothetical protein
VALNISDSERERRRQRALAMHNEPHPDDPTRRRLGGAQPNSGPRRQKRATEVAAERIARKGNLMADAVISAMGNDQPMTIRLQGVRMAKEIEHDEVRLQLQEQHDDETKSNLDLVNIIVDGLAKAAGSGRLKDIVEAQLEEPIIEGTVIE